MMSKLKKKPTKLDFEINLRTVNTSEYARVEVQGQQGNEQGHMSRIEDPKTIKGIVKIRREVKGRAGKPVTVLYDFSDQNAAHSPSLKHLQGLLKTKLACGGTFSPADRQIVLQLDDLAKVRLLLNDLGFAVKG